MSKIRHAIEIRERARENETYYFEAKRDRIVRNEEEAYDGVTNFGFRVCRLCLYPDTLVNVKSLFENAGKFQMIFGIDVSSDQGLAVAQLMLLLQFYRYQKTSTGTKHLYASNAQLTLKDLLS